MVKRLTVLVFVLASCWASGALTRSASEAAGSFENGLGWSIEQEWYMTERGCDKRIDDPTARNHQSIICVSDEHFFDGRHSAYGFSSIRTDNSWNTWEQGTRTILAKTLDLSGCSGVRLRALGQESGRAGVWGWCNELRARLGEGSGALDVALWVDHEAPFRENGNHRVRRELGADRAWWDVYEVRVPESMKRTNVRFAVVFGCYAWRNYPAASSMEAFVDGIEAF